MTTSQIASGTSLGAIEVGLAALSLTIALFWPALAKTLFAAVEKKFNELARRPGRAVFAVGATAFLMRLSILPLCPVPHPFILDAFSYLLAGDTFASGRLTNPTPPMWKHFESFQITMRPSYMSMYFPAHGMVLAAGEILTGHPWFGLLFVNTLMCAALCWMLQAWLPLNWAFVGGMLAVMRLGLFSYWINTYSGGGAIAAVGGALTLGALPRLMKHRRMSDGVILAAGVVILANSRPYEGLLLCLPVAVVLVQWLIRGPHKPTGYAFFKLVAMPAALVVAAILWMGYYNYRVFGDPFTEPYKISRMTYASAPHFVWQSARPEPTYRHAAMRQFYTGWELNYFNKVHTPSGFLREIPHKLLTAWLFYAGVLSLPILPLLPRALVDRRVRFLVVCVVVMTVGLLMETWLIPHYLSPFTAVFYAIGLQGMRHLWVWRPNGQPTGRALIRALVTICIVLTGVRTFATPLHLRLAGWPTWTWYGSEDFGAARARVLAELEAKPGRQLAIVRYARTHDSTNEWVYNAANIDQSKVIWAREMQAADDMELIHYYGDRKVWLVEPDRDQGTVTPYPVGERENAALHSINSAASLKTP